MSALTQNKYWRNIGARRCSKKTDIGALLAHAGAASAQYRRTLAQCWLIMAENSQFIFYNVGAILAHVGATLAQYWRTLAQKITRAPVGEYITPFRGGYISPGWHG